jgi:integrase
MLLLLYTLARRDEAAGARWADVDLDNKTWTIDDPKNKQTHVVPLSRQALALLSGLKPNSAKADTLVFATSSGTALGNWDRETKSVHADSGTALWHRHDLRRTSATMLGEMGELPDIVEAALNHVSIRSALAANYNRSRYRPRVAAALQRLGDALDGIEANAAEIIQLRPEAAA